MSYWDEKRVVVTGAASFIGSHLCEELVRRGAWVAGFDDLSSGKLENLKSLDYVDNFYFKTADLFQQVAREYAFACKPDVVFHLAAVHGGRGFINQHNADCSTNFALDNLCFHDAVKAGAKKIVFASSGCVLPNWKQGSPEREVYLEEWMTPKFYEEWVHQNAIDAEGFEMKRAYDADEIYGWAKLMAEFTLQAIHKDYGIETACCRYFTAYGPRAKEDHAVMTMIARAYTEQDPFEIWGDGTQIRNWTYIDDIVNGTILVAEKVTDGSGINVGTMERTSVLAAALMISNWLRSKRLKGKQDPSEPDEIGYMPEYKFLLDKPTGVMNRVASNNVIKELGYGEFLSFDEGVKKTIEWYMTNKTIEGAKALLEDGGLVDGRKR